jgi:ABC-type nitrate/sulfonate/bicarbonate transport system permease component
LTLYPVPAIALLSLIILWFDTSPTSMVVVTITFAGILVEATFRLLERGTVVRWGMKIGRE